jgi:transposase-like protein
MKTVARKITKKKALPAQLTLDTAREGGLARLVRDGLFDLITLAGTMALGDILERERTALCGPRWGRSPERQGHRGGHVRGRLVLGGREVIVRRPRAHAIDGGEMELPSWTELSATDPLHDRAVEQMLVGVSTRKYERSLEPVAAEMSPHGTSKSAVSRRFVERTSVEVEKWMTRSLASLDLVVLMIDGIHVGKHVMLVALGIDREGAKHIIGLHEGATENATSTKALLADMRERGLNTERPMLVVIDGGKALRAAVRDVFGARALVQRCQVHKGRNVTEHLPTAAAAAARKVMSQAYRSKDVTKAKKLLEGLARQLQSRHPSAAASLKEGLDETLTVMAMGLPDALERTLSTTNPIENLMGSIRQLTRRVKRWKGGQMIERWVGAALREANTRFHRVKGHAGMKKLSEVLERHAQPLVSDREAA